VNFTSQGRVGHWIFINVQKHRIETSANTQENEQNAFFLREKSAQCYVCHTPSIEYFFQTIFLILRVLARVDQTASLLLYGERLPFRTEGTKTSISSVILGYNLVWQAVPQIFCDLNWLDSMIIGKFRKKHTKVSPISCENEQYIQIS
jgi:hypothetical protein